MNRIVYFSVTCLWLISESKSKAVHVVLLWVLDSKLKATSLRKTMNCVFFQTGPHGVSVTKQNCFLPWLIRGRTAVKHKGPADALAFHSSPNPTSSLTQYQNTFMICLNCHPAECTHRHTHNAPLQIYTHTCLCGVLNGGGEKEDFHVSIVWLCNDSTVLFFPRLMSTRSLSWIPAWTKSSPVYPLAPTQTWAPVCRKATL